MKRFVLYIGGIIIVTFCGIASVNYSIDPGHIYSMDNLDGIIEGVKGGQNVEGVTNINERLYKTKLIEINKGKTFDYIALGSSRVMTLSEDALNGESLRNLGVSGCKIEDMIALYQICLSNNVRFSNAIIAADPTFFNAFDDDTRWHSIKNYYDVFMDVKSEGSYDWYKLENLFSASYFQSSVEALPNEISGKNQLHYVDTYINDGFTNRTDGSIYYDRNYRNRPQDVIDKEAMTWKHGSFNQFDTISHERVELFERLINRMKSDGVNVIFLQTPFHPVFYQRIFKIQGVVDAINYINIFAQKNDIDIIGSFNPSIVNFANNDFYDAAHPRKESLDVMLIDNKYVRDSN